MDPFAISRAHLDGGLDALGATGVPEALAAEALEAALVGAALRLAVFLLRQQGDAARRRQLLQQALAVSGTGLLQGAGLSVVLSLALALVPGGQAWLLGVSIWSLSRSMPAMVTDPFRIPCRRGD